ncbi:MAG: hypothetical protein ACR2FK_03955 [Sphingomicrobium sp.]
MTALLASGREWTTASTGRTLSSNFAPAMKGTPRHATARITPPLPG